MQRLSIIIPAYNEERTIQEILKRVRAVALPVERELIVVDDCSTDTTRSIIEKEIAEHGDITFVRHEKNAGKGSVTAV